MHSSGTLHSCPAAKHWGDSIHFVNPIHLASPYIHSYILPRFHKFLLPVLRGTLGKKNLINYIGSKLEYKHCKFILFFYLQLLCDQNLWRRFLVLQSCPFLQLLLLRLPLGNLGFIRACASRTLLCHTHKQTLHTFDHSISCTLRAVKTWTTDLLLGTAKCLAQQWNVENLNTDVDKHKVMCKNTTWYFLQCTAVQCAKISRSEPRSHCHLPHPPSNEHTLLS